MNLNCKDYFKALTQKVISDLPSHLSANMTFEGEEMKYVRFNESKIRQSTDVTQGHYSLSLQSGKKEAHFDWSLFWNLNQDKQKALDFINEFLKMEPFLTENSEVSAFEGSVQSEFVSRSETLPDVTQISHFLSQSGLDIAGLFASGVQWRANANSFGQMHWFESESHFFDYSIYSKDSAGNNKALKDSFLCKDWDQNTFQQNVLSLAKQQPYFSKPSKNIEPGKYRAYLSPSALKELIDLSSWGGWSYGVFKKGLSPLKKLGYGTSVFSEKLNLRENFNLGLTTPFNTRGEVAPKTVELVKNGQLVQFLISSSSASEYGVQSNQAESGSRKESLRSPQIDPGSIANDEILKTLGTGLYLGNLHYCNWSDPAEARATGMTRFGCFWVEDGQIAFPIEDLRFDVSLFDILGPEGLVGLTQDTQILPNTDTYNRRSLGGLSTPGAIVKEFACVL